MKQFIFLVLLSLLHCSCMNTQKESDVPHLFLDIHRLPAGTVKFTDVMAAHQKDLAVQKQFGVNFIKFWVDENNGLVYCLSTAPDTGSIRLTHEKAHGLLPDYISSVQQGQ